MRITVASPHELGAFPPNARVAVLSDGPELAGFFPSERRRLGVGVAIGEAGELRFVLDSRDIFGRP